MKGLNTKLTVSITKQGKRYVAYAPALDISTSASTEKAVLRRFGELVELFFEELQQAGTVAEVLSELGWRRQQKQWSPPEELSHKPITVRLPAFA